MKTKNVIFIQLDSLRYDVTMDTLKTLRKEGEIDDFLSEFHVFHNAYTTGSNTIHSVPAILSSTFFNKYHKKGNHIDEKLSFVSDILKKHSYKTVGVNSNPFLSSFFGYDKHFDSYHDGTTKEQTIGRSKFSERLKFILTPNLPYENAEEVGKKVRNIIFDLKKQKFFLWIFYMDTHMPYNKGKGILSIYNSKYLMSLAQKEKVSESVKNKMWKLYLESVEYTLKNIFNLLIELSTNDFYKDTIVIISSDHGESFWEHDTYGHKGRFHYKENIKAPLLMRVPGTGCKEYEELISLLDLTPTILDILSIDLPKSMCGKSFHPLIKESVGYSREYVITESEILDTNNSRLAVTTDRYKLIFNRDKRELYDLKTDPKEMNNIHKDAPEISRRLEDIGFEHIKHYQISSEKEHISEVPSEITSRLKALGYLD